MHLPSTKHVISKVKVQATMLPLSSRQRILSPHAEQRFKQAERIVFHSGILQLKEH